MCRDVITVLLLAVPLALSTTLRQSFARPERIPVQFSAYGQFEGTPPPTKHSTGPENRRRCVSPKVHTNASIIGGDIVQSGDKYPFLAWIGDNDGTGMAQFCGGSLISDRVVMTAGHCVYDNEIKNKNIYVRFKLADFKLEQGISRKVINWRRHERYNPFTLHYDIALLYLEESIPATAVKPVRISDGSKPFEKHGEKRITGWGSTDEECVVYDTLLRDATVPMGDYDDDCHTPGSKTVGKMEDFMVESQICAGMYRAGQMQYPGCGDSGGPLLADDGGEWTQVGFVSWSYGIPFPDIFTRVSHYNDWIQASSAEMAKEGYKKM